LSHGLSDKHMYRNALRKVSTQGRQVRQRAKRSSVQATWSPADGSNNAWAQANRDLGIG